MLKTNTTRKAKNNQSSKMKYVKLHKCRLSQDEVFPVPETGNQRGTTGDKEGEHKTNKVTKLMEAIQRVIMARDQRRVKEQNSDPASKDSDNQIKQFDGASNQG